MLLLKTASKHQIWKAWEWNLFTSSSYQDFVNYLSVNLKTDQVGEDSSNVLLGQHLKLHRQCSNIWLRLLQISEDFRSYEGLRNAYY